MEIMTCIGGSKKKKEKITDGNVDICRDTLNASAIVYKRQERGAPRPYRNQLSILNSNLSLPTDISA